jgi:hypothetical protein
MNKYYFSGLDRRQFFQILKENNAAGLINRKIIREKYLLRLIMEYQNSNLILDSGAFQEFTDVDEYIREFLPVIDLFEWVVNLDCIGNQEVSDNNYSVITRSIPSDYHSKIMWVFQNGSDCYFRRSLENRTFIGVGGLVPLSNKKSLLYSRLDWIGSILRDTSVKAHFFGIGSYDVIQRYKNEGWFYSADSQTWLVGAKAYELITLDGKRIRSRDSLMLSKRECLSNNIRVIHEWIK